MLVALLAGDGAAQTGSTALDLATLSPRLVGLENVPVRLDPPSPPADAADQWQFEVAPFIWFAGLDANLSVEGTTVGASPSFSDIWSNLNYAAMGHLEARKGKLAIFSDLVWMQLKDDNLSGPLGISSIDAKVEEFLGTANLAYQVLDLPLETGSTNGPRIQAEVYGGVRYTSLWAQLNPQVLNTVSDSADWWDPLIGVRTHLIVTPKFTLVGQWDFGGWGVGCDHTWFLSGGIQYRAFDAVSILAGYAALYQDYDGSGNTSYKATTQGPYLGISLAF